MESSSLCLILKVKGILLSECITLGNPSWLTWLFLDSIFLSTMYPTLLLWNTRKRWFRHIVAWLAKKISTRCPFHFQTELSYCFGYAVLCIAFIMHWKWWEEYVKKGNMFPLNEDSTTKHCTVQHLTVSHFRKVEKPFLDKKWTSNCGRFCQYYMVIELLIFNLKL